MDHEEMMRHQRNWSVVSSARSELTESSAVGVFENEARVYENETGRSVNLLMIE